MRETSGTKRIRRDVKYAAEGMLVELDGQFGHRDAQDRWADLDRDLAAAISALLTLRLGWAQVLRPCRSAAAIATIMQARGWSGHPVSCGPDCRVADRVDLVSPADTNATRSA